MSSPVVYVGFTLRHPGQKVFALNATTGAQVWSFTTGDWVDSTPAVSGGRVYVAGRDGKLYCLDAATGILVWSHTTGSTDQSSPLVYGGEVYHATGFPSKTLKILDAKTGSVKRSVVLSQFTASSPVLDKAAGKIYIATNDGRYNAFSASLTPLWSDPIQTLGGIQMATPALSDGRLLAVPGDADVTAHSYNPDNGTLQWTSDDVCATTNHPASVAVSTTSAIINSGCATLSLRAMDLSAGETRWSVNLGAPSALLMGSPPSLAQDVAYVMNPAGELYAVQTATGGILARVNMAAGEGLGSPAISNGWVYAGTMGGKVFGFEGARAAAITSPDPLLDTVEGVMTIKGTVLNPALDSYRLEYGSGTSPSQWTTLSTGSAEVRDQTLAVWDARDAPDGIYTLRLTAQETGVSLLLNEAQAQVAVSQIKTASLDASSGCVVTLADGTEVVFPAGALSENDTISVRKLFTGYSNGGIPNGVLASDIVREFTVGSSAHPQFLKPVTIRIPYSSFSPRKEENLRMFWFDDEKRKWNVVNTSEVDTANRKVSATVDHFTIFRVMEFTPSSTLLDSAEVYTYPNPATGNTVTFKFRLGDSASVAIRVYDVSGAQVADLRAPRTVLGGTIGEVDWNISGKASGVYIYRLEATAADGRRSNVKKKLAIIH